MCRGLYCLCLYQIAELETEIARVTDLIKFESEQTTSPRIEERIVSVY